MEKKDWTKLVVPRTVDPQAQTVDYVTLSSAADLQDQTNPLRLKPATDFVARRGVETGIAPVLSLRLPAGYTMQQLTEQFGLTEQTNPKGETFYQVTLGEYPRSRATGLWRSDLSDRYLDLINFDLDEGEDFRCTGRLFTVAMVDPDDQTKTISVQYPEYSRNGYKFVRVHKSYGVDDWYEVEPLRFGVKNYDAIASGQAQQMDLECAEVIMEGIPFQSWSNSALRAFLNSTAVQQPDGTRCDYTQGGFLQQALNLTKEPIREYTVPAHESNIESSAFAGCRSLEKIIIPPHVRSIGMAAFEHCYKTQIWVGLSEHDTQFPMGNYWGCKPQYMYVPKTTDGQWMVLAPEKDAKLEQDYHCIPIEYTNQYLEWFNYNYRNNFIQLNQWKSEQKIKFIPPKYVMKVFPASEMANFFVNNNHKRWKELTQALNFDLLEPEKKANTLRDLMKIYYALGGFSKHQGEREQAFDYVVQHVAKMDMEVTEQTAVMETLLGLPSMLAESALAAGYTTQEKEQYAPDKMHVQWLGDEIHGRFSRLVLKGPHNPVFAQFFMKYYHKNHNFMKFDLGADEQDYLCLAHNHFDKILENYPNRVVNGNTERDLLTPKFVAEHSVVVSYENVDSENRELAELVGKYGYDQEQFGRMQQIFNTAKTVKSRAVIRANETTATNGISFRVLEKDDPLGFVIGDITNCCQHIGGAGGDCVSDGYINPHAGFLVFETDEKRILGQAYVWYDPETYTVCYDNIEIPDKVLTELKHGEKHHANLSMSNLMQAVIHSADAIMTTMNRNGTKVERVTMGEGYNDLRSALDKHYPLVKDRAEHRHYHGYTDAHDQYLIRTYDQVKTKLTTMTANTSADLLKAATKPTDNAERTLPTL